MSHPTSPIGFGCEPKTWERVKELESENKRLREALEWFADDGNYCSDLQGSILATSFERHGLQNKAREALKATHATRARAEDKK